MCGNWNFAYQHSTFCIKIALMTPNEFRKLALNFPGAIESAHMNHPDFRIGGKIFATLGPGESWGMVKLTPEQQRSFMQEEPNVFSPCSGAWGRGGATTVNLASAKQGLVKTALSAAFQNVSAKSRKQKRQ